MYLNGIEVTHSKTWILVKVHTILYRSVNRRLMPSLGQGKYKVVLGILAIPEVKETCKNQKSYYKPSEGASHHQSWGIRKNNGD